MSFRTLRKTFCCDLGLRSRSSVRERKFVVYCRFENLLELWKKKLDINKFKTYRDGIHKLGHMCNDLWIPFWLKVKDTNFLFLEYEHEMCCFNSKILWELSIAKNMLQVNVSCYQGMLIHTSILEVALE